MKRILFDLEADGLLDNVTKIHCIATVDVDTLERRVFGPDDCKGPFVLGAAFEYLRTADVLIAHFGAGYDFLVMEKVAGFVVPFEKQLDTVIIARLKHPNVKETDSALNKHRIATGGETMGDQFGKHTIEAWGLRLKCPKLHTDIEDWSEWTAQIQERCVGDVETCLKIWQFLNPDAYSQDAIILEHRIARVCRMMTAAGWPFDERKAGELHAKLLTEKDIAEKKLVADFGGWWAPKKSKKLLRKEFVERFPEARKVIYEHFTADQKVPEPFVPKKVDTYRGYWGEYQDIMGEDAKTGEPAVLMRYFKGYPCTQIEWVTFNPASRDHIERCLRKAGWEPQEFTDSGKAKLDEEILDGVGAEFPQAAGLTNYLMLDKRLGQLVTGNQAWLSKVASDGRIHASYNPMGTITSRAAHFDPNIGQVPAASSTYGHECRELFTVPAGFEMLGVDMSSLEGLCLAHYLAKHDGGAYGRVLLEGDPHWAVTKVMGLIDCERDKENKLHTILRETGAKRAFYAMMYGAGDEKVGRIVLDACRLARKTNPEWSFVYEKFFGAEEAPRPKLLKEVGSKAKFGVIHGIEGFDKLMSSIMGRATLPGLDNRRIPIRSDHSALNSLLQCAGALLCKRWVCDSYDALLAEGFVWGEDFWMLGWIHDELQIACRKGTTERIAEIVAKCAKEAGEPYGFRVPLSSGQKIGLTWADTH